MLRMLDLFAGIGGFSYAGEKLVGGFETVAFCEYDEHAQKVLRKHWPDTEIIKDIRELADDADRFRGMVDIITGGYPCQPFSTAGQRRGDKDDRHLWPEMLRVIQAVRPTWVIGENVAGHISMGLDTVLSDLEGEGYQARCFVIPAVAADAPHRRDRCWVVAHSGGGRHRVEEEKIFAGGDGTFPSSAKARDVADARCQQQRAEVSRSGGQSIDGAAQGQRTEARDRFADSGEDVADASDQRVRRSGQFGDASCCGQRQGGVGRDVLPGRYEEKAADLADRRSEGIGERPERFWLPEPELGRVAYGVPSRVHRLKQLGNSIVPQVAARILYAIKEADNASEIRD